MSLVTERPPFETPDFSEEDLRRGQELTEILIKLNDITSRWQSYGAALLNARFSETDDTKLVVVPSFQIPYETIGWKAHKGESVVGEGESDTPFVAYSVSVVTDQDDKLVPRMLATTHWWTPTTEIAHQLYEQYYFDLREHRLAIIEASGL